MDKERSRLKISLGLSLAVVVMEIIAAVLSYGNNGSGMFRFYTEDSNIFTFFACLIYSVCAVRALRGGVIPGWVKTFKYMAVCCLSVTFLVVVCVLSPMYGAGGYKVMLFYSSMLFHHFLCPLTAAASFLFFEPWPEYTPRKAAVALIPTVIYAAVTVTLNIAKVMEGPYPFLYVYKQPVYMSVIWVAVIIGGAYLIARLLGYANRRLCPVPAENPKNS